MLAASSTGKGLGVQTVGKLCTCSVGLLREW